jgi:filamentous hemagglutinin
MVPCQVVGDCRTEELSGPDHALEWGGVRLPHRGEINWGNVNTSDGYQLVWDHGGNDHTAFIVGPNEATLSEDHSERAIFEEYQYNRRVEEEQVTRSDPAQLLAGKDLALTGGDVLNDKSHILAGGSLTFQGGMLDNAEYRGLIRLTDTGTRTHWSQVFDSDDNHESIKSFSAYQAVTDSHALLEGRAAGEQTLAPSAGGALVGRAQQSLLNLGNALFALADPGQTYLIETDPAYTNKQAFLSSDYFFEQWQLDPSTTQKRLGDGFYEQRLLNEQVAQLTGQRHLPGYANDEEQYRALMQSGLEWQERFQLAPGVALSAEQMAALTTDMVWLVAETVTLADGTTQTALTPKLYLAAGTEPEREDFGIALIGANRIEITAAGNLVNRGTIQGRERLQIAAADIGNRGRLKGGDVIVVAQNDFTSAGRIEGTEAACADRGQEQHRRRKAGSSERAVPHPVPARLSRNPGGPDRRGAGQRGHYQGAVAGSGDQDARRDAEELALVQGSGGYQ